MLSIPTDDIQAVYEGQPLMQTPEEFPPPGGLTASGADEEEAGDASR